jgi:hypothetical protein
MARPTIRKAVDPWPPGEPEFSLVLGGPLFRLLRRAKVCDDTLGLMHRRIFLVALITWAPLAVLSVVQGMFLGQGRAPFLQDLGVHLRFLVATPLLIVAEPIVHWRLRPIIVQFRLRNLVRPAQAARFTEALDKLARWRNSIAGELLLIAIVYVGGIMLAWPRYASLEAGAWPISPGPQGHGLSLAGFWLVFVSLPVFQFLLLRWYFRLFLWAQFLWRVAWLDLELYAIHPDKAGGLGFLGEFLNAVVPIAAAHGVLVAGMVADRILYAGAKLTDFEVAIVGVLAFLLFLFAGPLLLFVPRLARVKRVGLKEYGALGQTYVRDFYVKWFGSRPPGEPLVGSGDIQSLADLGNSYGSAEQMRIVPISRSAVLQFVAAFLAPILPLVLTMISVEKLIGKLVGIVF